MARRLDELRGDERAKLQQEYYALMDERAKINPEEIYALSAGETEARNIQRRMRMDTHQRRQYPPFSTMDRPQNRQYVERY